ncbi:hypothetical protein ZWY2020_014551 [Hordeum vulgare]|nr:hypothetical protein ZWY2020_014551 [Hordeum vulgare]
MTREREALEEARETDIHFNPGNSRLDAWRTSAARAGGYLALRLAKSWYQNLDLGKLAAQRASLKEELLALEDQLQVRASGIASFAAWDEFGLEHDADGNVVLEDMFYMQPYDAEGSSAEADFEEEAADSSSKAYADSTTKNGVAGARGRDGASTSGVAGDGEATT